MDLQAFALTSRSISLPHLTGAHLARPDLKGSPPRMHPVHRLLLSTGLLALTVATPGQPARAHEGHDHDDAPPPPRQAIAGGILLESSTDQVELVLKGPVPRAGEPFPFRLLLADHATNRPIGQARIDLEIAGAAIATTSVVPARDPGIYEATLSVPVPGEVKIICSLSAGGLDDLVVLEGLVVQPRRAAGTPFGWPRMVGAGSGLLGVWALTWWAWRRKRKVAGAGALALLIAMAPPAMAHEGHDHEAPVAPPIRVGTPIVIAKESQFLLGITTRPAERREVAERLEWLGHVVPPVRAVATLHAPVEGRVIPPVRSELGSRVRKGQTLAIVEQILSSSDQIQLASDRLRLATERAQLETALAQARRERDRARLEHERLLGIRDLVAGKLVVEAETARRKAADAVAGLERQLGAYQRLSPPSLEQARRFSIVAPFDGLLVEAHATPGEQVDPTKPLFQVVDPSLMWVEADVFERDLGRLSKVREARISVEAFPGATFRGSLVSVGQTLDPESRTVPARFAVPNPDGRLRTGLFARVGADVGERRRVLSVPVEALSELQGRKVVFVHTSAEVFVAREVTPGTVEAGQVAILAGLVAGDRVVVEGVYQVRSTAERGGRR